MSFDLLPGMVGMEARPGYLPPLSLPGEILLAALEKPLGSPPLSDLVNHRSRVCVVVPDSTRPFPVRELLPVVLDCLFRCGLPDEQVEVALAYGLHRRLSAEDKVRFLGKGVFSRYRVVDHDATDTESLVRIGETSGGVPIVLNRAVTRADLVLSLGVVEPHQYAGYSGGAKAVAIGMAGVDTIQATHSAAFLDHPGAQRAYLLGQALMKHPVLMVGAACPDLVRQLGMIPCSDMNEALEKAASIINQSIFVLVVPHALRTLPSLAPEPRPLATNSERAAHPG